MGMKTKPSKASAKKVVMPSKEAIMDCNNNEAGELLLSKLVNDKTIEYASRDIMLSDIRLNQIMRSSGRMITMRISKLLRKILKGMD